MKEIKLTRGLVALVDDDDYEFLNQYRWKALKGKKTFYAEMAINLGTDASGKRKRKYILMHRLILGLTDRSVEGDHADRNGLNNQKSNLRIATSIQNNRNRSSWRRSTSKYLGVCWEKQKQKWKAAIKYGGKQKTIGYFQNEKEAALAYNEAAAKHFLEFANLNIIN